MGFADRLRALTRKAQDAAVEHEEQVHQAVEKAELAADQRTGGQYHDQIAKAGAKADAYVDSLKSNEPTPNAAQGPNASDEGSPRW